MTDLTSDVIVGLVTGGAAVALIAWAREWWRSRQPAAIEQASLAVVATARDELAEDNDRLREQIVEMRRQHTEDRVRWSTEKATLVAEIDTLWKTVVELRQRVHALPDPAAPQEAGA